jgi:hypothetical protein
VNNQSPTGATSGASAPPAGEGLPRNGCQRGLDGSPDPLGLGAGGVDQRPDGRLPGRTADELAYKNPFGGAPITQR